MTALQALEEVNVDEHIDRLEKEISVRSISDTLWGGPKGPGLIYAVAELNKSAVSLAESVARLATEIHGDDGMKTTLRELRRDVKQMKDERKVFVVAFWFLVLLGLATLFANGHILFQSLHDVGK